MSVKPPDRVRLEHVPTGERACVEMYSASRNFSWAFQNAVSLLRSRLYAAQTGQGRSQQEVAVYELPEDTPYPFDLSEYRRDAQ